MDARKADAADKRVGQRLKLLRETSGMSQAALAEAIGVSVQQLQKYEKGINRLPAGRLQHTAGILGVAPTRFFDEPGEGQKIGADPLSTALQLKGSVPLLLAFASIPEAKLRESILELVNSIATTADRAVPAR